MTPYQVELDAFHGPLDLLLYLVKKEEVDIFEVSIAHLAGNFLEYLQSLREMDLELAGEFLVMAATLMQIKSRSLVPEIETAPESEETDPRRELVRQLMEYRKYKDAAAALEAHYDERATRIARTPALEPTLPTAVAARTVELWDLVSAFGRMLRETQETRQHTVVVDETPQHLDIAAIRQRLALEGRLHFREIFKPPLPRSRLIGLFLAMLEMVKMGVVWLEGGPGEDDIILSLRDVGCPSKPDS